MLIYMCLYVYMPVMCCVVLLTYPYHNTRQVAMAAVIGVADPKWDERPLLVAVKKEGAYIRLHGKGCVCMWR